MFEADILDYVIYMMQSKPAILRQISEGYPYYLIQPENDAIGYFSIRTSQRDDEIQLGKLYLLFTQRGKGLGKQVIGSLEKTAREQGISKMVLSVFEKNTESFKKYEKLGFRHTGSLDKDIGNGIVIHNYTMEKTVG